MALVLGDGFCDVCGSTFEKEHFQMTGAYIAGVADFRACRGCMEEALRRRSWSSGGGKMCDAVGYSGDDGGNIVTYRTNHPHFDHYYLSEAAAREILNNRAFHKSDKATAGRAR